MIRARMRSPRRTVSRCGYGRTRRYATCPSNLVVFRATKKPAHMDKQEEATACGGLLLCR